MRVPAVRRRRHYRNSRDPYMESDNDFVANNMRACVWFLEHRDELVERLKKVVDDQDLAQLMYPESK